MSHSFLPGRTARAAFAAVAIAAVAPVSAHAATSPLRYVGIAVDGTRTWENNWLAISPGGTELVGTRELGPYAVLPSENGVLSRDVVTGKTTELVPGPAGLDAASSDLQRLIFHTKASYSPKDTNTLRDFYVLDRATGTKTLLSADADGNAIGDQNDGYDEDGTPGRWFHSVAISGNGKVAQIAVLQFLSTGGVDSDYTQRVSLETGARTDLPQAESAYATAMDDAGRIAVSGGHIFIDGVKRFEAPKGVEQLVISPGGTFAAGLSLYRDTVVGIDLQTGAIGSTPLPSYGDSYVPRVRHVADDGGSVILSDVLGQRSATPRLVFGRLDRNGALTQLGGDVPFTDWEWLGEFQEDKRGGITADGAFAFTGLHVAQLGSKPLPGVEPAVPSTPQMSDYVFIGDAACIKWTPWAPWLPRTYSRPRATLAFKAQRTDLRHAVAFTGKVSRTKTGAVTTPNLVLVPGTPVELPSIGYNGGFKVEGTVTLNDGTKLTGSSVVASHAAPSQCPPFGSF